MPGYRLLAAVDLGSNSFRLLIGRVESSPLGELVLPLDGVKQTVRLAGGLREDGSLDAASRERALAALAMFGERLRSFAPEAVRAVATNTLRVASNAAQFLATAEAVLGFPIEVVSGLEEARLIYLGAAHELPLDGVPRLVVDIGGGSTECVVGTDMRASALESAPAGCVALSTRHFRDGRVEREAFEHAYYAARAVFAQVAEPFANHRWRYAVGTSGTAKSLWQIAQAQWGADELDRDSLARIHGAMIEAGHVDAVQLAGLRPERRPVLAGGLAVMMAAFDELGIDSMRYCGGALRQGVLYDMLGRSEGRDTRAITVEQMLARYGVDGRHARRVRDTALALFDQGARGALEVLQARRQVLGWAAELAEVGMSISHEGFHKHSAYILGHADMPGFSRREQASLATLALAQIGGLRKLRGLIDDDLGWLKVVALRVSTILHRKRDEQEVPTPALFLQRRSLRLEMPRQWARRFPLAHESLIGEASAWSEVRVFEKFVYETI
ncbi:MAG: Ppx/GppA family phosphatase [Burkholderiaceae bacterium]|nr:Ppx/GppA family phosphatase [Burkholderiaceae bacterium]